MEKQDIIYKRIKVKVDKFRHCYLGTVVIYVAVVKITEILSYMLAIMSELQEAKKVARQEGIKNLYGWTSLCMGIYHQPKRPKQRKGRIIKL